MPVSWIAKPGGGTDITSATLFGSPQIIGGALYKWQNEQLFCSVRPSGSGWFKVGIMNMAAYRGKAGALKFEVDMPQPAWLPADSPTKPISQRHRTDWRFSPYAPAMVCCIGYIENTEHDDEDIELTRFHHIGLLEIIVTPIYSGLTLAGVSAEIGRTVFEEYGLIMAADYAYRSPDDATEYEYDDPGKIRYIRNRLMVNAGVAGHADVVIENLGGTPTGSLGAYGSTGVYGHGITHSMSYVGPGSYTVSTSIGIPAGMGFWTDIKNFTDVLSAGPSVVYAASGIPEEPSHWHELTARCYLVDCVSRLEWWEYGAGSAYRERLGYHGPWGYYWHWFSATDTLIRGFLVAGMGANPPSESPADAEWDAILAGHLADNPGHVAIGQSLVGGNAIFDNAWSVTASGYTPPAETAFRGDWISWGKGDETQGDWAESLMVQVYGYSRYAGKVTQLCLRSDVFVVQHHIWKGDKDRPTIGNSADRDEWFGLKYEIIVGDGESSANDEVLADGWDTDPRTIPTVGYGSYEEFDGSSRFIEGTDAEDLDFYCPLPARLRMAAIPLTQPEVINAHPLGHFALYSHPLEAQVRPFSTLYYGLSLEVGSLYWQTGCPFQAPKIDLISWRLPDGTRVNTTHQAMFEEGRGPTPHHDFFDGAGSYPAEGMPNISGLWLL